MTGLVLAGTSEARLLCEALGKSKVDAIASLAGETRSPRALDINTRIGGFGGYTGLSQFIAENDIKWVVDATHPFAVQMSKTNADVCSKLGVPTISLQRPEWVPTSVDKWHFVDRIRDLPTLIPNKSTVFLGTGRKTLSEYSVLDGRRLICRVIDAPVGDFPFKGGSFQVGRPPFSVEEEMTLFQREGVDWLVVKNAGGSGGFSKLVAARNLGLHVAMINRQKMPDVSLKTNVSDAINWVQGISS
jgi:precorrin-6A/cobalt-precorrin-6A reductase